MLPSCCGELGEMRYGDTSRDLGGGFEMSPSSAASSGDLSGERAAFRLKSLSSLALSVEIERADLTMSLTIRLAW